VDDVEVVEVPARTDLLRGIEPESATEHREPSEQHALGVGEQVVTPVNRGGKRLVPFDDVASAAGEEPEALVEARRNLRRAHRSDARGC
jgi:hypothetical protein